MKYTQKKGKQYNPTKDAKEIFLVEQDVYKKAKNREQFWINLARKGISWNKPFTSGFKRKGLGFSWFEDGKLNLCYNAVDRHMNHHDNTAIIFIPESVKEPVQKISYKRLFEMVNQAALELKNNGIKKGDVVAIYMPLIPEALVYMLACARIGAIHSVVFSAFSPDALRTRIIDGGAKLVITSNYYFRRGKKINLLKNARKAWSGIKIKKIIINRRKTGRIFTDKKIKIVEPESMNSEDTAFILYTSGTTGKPKGVMHAVGGYTVQAYWSCRYLFNLQPSEVMWCTADIGWITGHTYACYGPFLNGATTIIFEGMLDYPKPDRYLKILNNHKVNVFYTAPTALRLFTQYGTGYPRKYKLNSMKVLGSVGEPIDEATWKWFFDNIGKKRCPIIDTYWQTETGSAIIASLPSVTPIIPTKAGKSFPGFEHKIVNDHGKHISTGKKGLLIQLPPFAPSLIRGVWKNPKRYKKYFLKNNYLTGDNAYVDSAGNFRILGRSDDIIKVAGHRLSTAEIENAIDSIKGVVEVAIVAKLDQLRGEVPVAFVKAKAKVNEKIIMDIVIKKIGPIAKPKEIYLVEDLPKTRSGKIMRRILKAIVNGEDTGNLMTLVNPDSVEEIKKIVGESSKK